MAGSAQRSFPVPNMVQGVSQQAPQNRRETQCEAQFDCINSPVVGCDARPPVEFNSLLVDADYTDSFFYEIKRGVDEHYLVVISAGALGGLEIFDLKTGDPCDVTLETGADDYLATVGKPKNVFVATTVDDYTFVCNREVLPGIDTGATSPAKRNEALIYWKASAYKIKFALALTYGGNVYEWTYETPDNSTAGNAEYITTTAVAATFYRSMTGLAAPQHGTGANAATGTNQGTLAGHAGHTAGVSGTIHVQDLGFYIRINGNCILLGRNDSAAFKVDTSDGVGDTYMRAVKDYAQSFADLPKNAFEGFTCKVQGTNKQTQDDYYVRFTRGDGSAGVWEESVAPGVPLGFDATTMPYALINTGVGTFEFKKAPWQGRVSGDGVDSALDPSFADRQIFDMFYDNNRLALMTEGACSWSMANNPFVHFPSSAQTTLATDPVDIRVGGGKQIVLLRKAVQTNEQTYLWAQKKQFRVASGNESFRQDTVESKPVTSFEFAEIPEPLPVADSLYFVTEPGKFATVRDLTLRDGKPLGSADVTAHVKRYIRSGVRRMAASDTLGIMVLASDNAPSYLYVYNFLIGDNENGAVTRLQSAWNTWRLPRFGTILWVTIQAERMDLVIQRPEGVILAQMDLSQDRTDDGHDDYLIRCDLRMTEANTARTYDPDTGATTIVFPFDILEAQDDGTKEAKDQNFFVVQRTTSVVQRRGYRWVLVDSGPNWVSVEGDCTAEELFCGFRIRAERDESPFYIRTAKGLIPADEITVHTYTVTHAKTGYYRAEVSYKTQNRKTGIYEMTGRVLGSQDNVLGEFAMTDGQLKVPISSDNLGYTLKLINDSYLPSRWQTSTYVYSAKMMALPQGAGS